MAKTGEHGGVVEGARRHDAEFRTLADEDGWRMCRERDWTRKVGTATYFADRPVLQLRSFPGEIGGCPRFSLTDAGVHSLFS